MISKNAALVALFAFLAALFCVEKAFPQIEEKSDAYFSETVREAGIAFASARALNAVISVVKDSSVSAAPAGIGVELAIGQALDPLDDVIERLSDILFTTIVALSIQKIVYEIVGNVALIAVAVSLLGACAATAFSSRERVRALADWLKKAAFILLLVRVALPGTALLSELVETQYFAPRIAECREKLRIQGVSLPAFDVEFSEEDGVWARIEKMGAQTKNVVVASKDALGRLVDCAEEFVAASLNIAGLYIALFCIQVIFLPLGAFFIIVKSANRLFASRVPVVLSAPHLGENAPNA